ncbi:hypothetical protein [Amycolatopsis sp. CA-230715]|uniref:hypothetical protein n=1 Tax=Amycolatopsis sp. CA-230715 TaxID=2745196 RepID=UPI001C00E409|nr:hypothetical protein [Amycolatopsis sp. CA-230715]QWF77969.1 hypothetical protein HUW46_01362 [Amycolatopsis sp. CA-230715]
MASSGTRRRWLVVLAVLVVAVGMTVVVVLARQDDHPAQAPAPTPSQSTAPRPTTTVTPVPGKFGGEEFTPAQVAALQSTVDAGHQPWRLDPAQVARAFVEIRFGWTGPSVAMADPHTAEVTDPVTGTKLVLQLGQPAKLGQAGIWIVLSGVRVT